PAEVLTQFDVGSQLIELAGVTLNVEDGRVARDIYEHSTHMLIRLSEMQLRPETAERLRLGLSNMLRFASVGRVNQQTVNNLLAVCDRMSVEERNALIGLVETSTHGPWYEALLNYLKNPEG